jgi:hypothetical protein
MGAAAKPDANVFLVGLENSDLVGASSVTTLSTDYLTKMRPYERMDAAIVAFVPVPLGWGFVYLVLFLVRWVKNGFLL